MNEIQKIHALRETLEMATRVIIQCDNFIQIIYSDTPGRKQILKEIENYKDHFEKVFTPEVINPDEKA